MRKATGKVVSLVLALALVITSFSATFASAASTKTESAGSISAPDSTIYLANLSDLEGGALDAAKSAGRDSFDLTTYVAGAQMWTEDHILADDAEISSVSVSGDNIIRVTKNSVDNHYYVTVRDVNATGTATINVLYTAKASELREDEEEAVTVRGSQKFTVVLLDAETPILGAANAANKPAGEGVDGIADLQKNPALDSTKTTESGYVEGDNGDPMSAATAQVYLPYADEDSAMAKYEAQTVIEKDLDDDTYNANDDEEYDTIITDPDSTYVVSASGTGANISVDASNKMITYGIENPTVGKTVRVTVASLKETGTAGSKIYTTNKTVLTDTSKVLNKVVGEFTEVKLGEGQTNQFISATGTGTLSKSKAYVAIVVDPSTGEDETHYWDVTGADIESTATNKLTLTNVKVGNVSAISTSGIELVDSTAADVTAKSADGSAKYDVVVSGGSVTGKVTGANVDVLDEASVADISATATVEVTDGKVTGTIEATAVTVGPTNDEDAASVNAVKATTLTVNGSMGKAAAGSYFATTEDDSVLTLKGDQATIGSVNADYRNATITLENFVGVVPAIQKGNYTGYDKTGVTLTTSDDSDEDATKATVSGNVDIKTLSLNEGVITFAGKVNVVDVFGNEADMIINAGALNITGSVSTSNVLKIADAADVAAGTLVYTAATDIAATDSFQTYGYELKLVAGKTYDGFVIESVDFAGLTLDVGNSIELVVGETAVVTASAYPNGTNLPEGTKVEFYLNDADLNYIEGANLGNNQASVTALKYSEDFDVLNKGKLVAVVLDEYDIQLEEYGEAVCDITVVKTKAPTETYKSDTTGDVVVASGNTYQFKITSLNGQAPSVVLGSAGVFELVGTAQEGNDYFFKFQAVGASGAATGVYVNGDAKVATMYVDGNTGYTCDTTTVNVPAGGAYQVKITAASMPTLLPGNSIYTVAFASQEGNDYFFKITATSAQAGDVVGFYINGGARAFVATTV